MADRPPALPPPRSVRAYHGSNVAGIERIRPGERGPFGPATYLSPNDRVASRYGDNLYQADVPEIFHGLGSTGFADRDVNPYDVWREQTGRLLAAIEPEKRPELEAIISKMHPEDGYPFFRRVANLMGSSEAAQDLFKRAGFQGVSGHVDGPEIAVFGEVTPIVADKPKPPPLPAPLLGQARRAIQAGDELGYGRNYSLGLIKFGQEGMTPEAVKGRAEAQGYDTERVLYHATPSNFEAFRPSKKGLLGPGVYLTDSPSYAARYIGDKEGANIIPVLTSAHLAKPSDIDSAWNETSKDLSGQEFNEAVDANLKSKGFEGKDRGTQIVVLDPAKIRSPNATFNPSRSGRKDLLAAKILVPLGIAGATYAALQPQPAAADTGDLEADIGNRRRQGERGVIPRLALGNIAQFDPSGATAAINEGYNAGEDAGQIVGRIPDRAARNAALFPLEAATGVLGMIGKIPDLAIDAVTRATRPVPASAQAPRQTIRTKAPSLPPPRFR